MEGSIQWWLGDWLNYGERKYGDKYTQAVEAGFDYGTARDAKWVSSAFKFVRRRTDLSWSHHKEVAALEPPIADRLLEQAEKEGWSVQNLRGAVIALNRSERWIAAGKLSTSNGLIPGTSPYQPIIIDSENCPLLKKSRRLVSVAA